MVGSPEFLRSNHVQINDNNFVQENFDQDELIDTCVYINTNNENNLCNLNNVIDFRRYSNYNNIIRITAWINRFVSNLKLKVKKKKILTKPTLQVNELKEAEKLLMKANQYDFRCNISRENEVKFRNLNVKLDDENIFCCEGRLQFAPISKEAKSPILLNEKHPLTKLIIIDIHRSNKHISVKYTLNEFRQRYWMFCGRRIIRNIIRACVICRKRSCKSYQYPPTPPLTPLRLNDSRPFFTTGIDNFGPVYVRNIYFVENDTMHKAWVTLYTCAASRAICLDVVPSCSAASFINSFKRIISRRGCPDNVISDNAGNFDCTETDNFVASRKVEWHKNLPLAPWHGGFFKRLVKNVKDLLIKELGHNRLSFEELQTLLFEIEAILNNRPLTYQYPTDLQSCLSPNHLLFGRSLQLSSIQSSPLSINVDFVEYSKRVKTIIDRFWNQWRNEYLLDLRETHKHYCTNKHQPIIQINDVVLIHSEKLPRSMWRIGIVIELLKGKMDNSIRGAIVRLPNKTELRRPVNKLYPIEYVRKPAEKETLRTRREAAVLGELKRRFGHQ